TKFKWMINILNGFKKDFVELLKVLTEQLIVILMKLLTTLTILLLRLEQLKMNYMKTVRKWQIRKIIHWLPTPLLIIPKSRLQSLYPIQAYDWAHLRNTISPKEFLKPITI